MAIEFVIADNTIKRIVGSNVLAERLLYNTDSGWRNRLEDCTKFSSLSAAVEVAGPLREKEALPLNIMSLNKVGHQMQVGIIEF